MSSPALPDVVERVRLFETRLAEATASDGLQVDPSPPFDKALAEGPALLAIIARMAPFPPSGRPTVQALADFFCNLAAWFEVAEKHVATLNMYLFADGLSSNKVDPLAKYITEIVNQSDRMIRSRVPGTGLHGRPVFSLRIEDVRGYRIELADAPLHFSSAWALRVKRPHGFVPAGDRENFYLMAIATGDPTRAALDEAQIHWNDKASKAICNEVTRAATAIAKGAASRMAQFITTSDNDGVPAQATVTVEIVGNTGYPPKKAVLTLRVGTRVLRTQRLAAPSLVRLLVVVIEAKGKQLAWPEVVTRWMAQHSHWKGRVLTENTLRDYGRRLRKRLTDGGFGEYWMYSPDSITWAGVVEVTRRER